MMNDNREEIKKNLEITGSETYKNQVIDFIKDIVCNYYGLEKDVYESRSRKTDNIKVRHTAIYLSYTNIRIGPTHLSKKFNCDHASILHAVKKIKDHSQFDKDFRRELQEIQNLVSHKGKTVNGKFNLNSDYYYINFNDVVTLRLPNGGAIAFTGVSNEMIDDLRVNFFHANERQVTHEKTGLYILKNLSSEQK